LIAAPARPATTARSWTVALAACLVAVSFGALALPAAMFVLRGALLGAVAHALVADDPPPAHVDAVAIHGGGSPAREREIPAALMLGTQAEVVVAMGGRLPCCDPDITYAGATLRRLRELGVDEERIVALNKGLSTEGELRALRELAEARGWRSLAISTTPWHTRRAGIIARDVFAGSGIAIAEIAMPGAEADLDGWWRTPYGRVVVLGEWWKLAYYALSS
jgi:uncharacterized SAM-binding protein YcdF (DUF218 family)